MWCYNPLYMVSLGYQDETSLFLLSTDPKPKGIRTSHHLSFENKSIE